MTNQSGSWGAVFGLGGMYLGVPEEDAFDLFEIVGILGIEFGLVVPMELPPCNKDN